MQEIKNQVENLQLYVELLQERNELIKEVKILLVISGILLIILMGFVLTFIRLIPLIK